MVISVCITVKNEENSIGELIKSLLWQSKKPEEIIIVDGGSTDNTLSEISKLKFTNQIQKTRFKILQVPGASIAHGRNVAIKKATGDIIVTTDAGCVAKKDWLEKITKPFSDKNVDVVAGFYEMKGQTYFSQALRPYLGIVPERYDVNSYLPSTRSMAFRKTVWSRVNGFRENLNGAGEDSAFNYDLLKAGYNITRIKNAIVYWQMPDNFKTAFYKFYNYAKDDIKTNIWNITSHNIHALFVVLRYLVFLGIIIFIWLFQLPFYLVICLGAMYLIYPVLKFKDLRISWQVGVWLPLIQIISDLAVISGFTAGILMVHEK
jgi:glycosyltransferase involved in cell wall biosynthesis